MPKRATGHSSSVSLDRVAAVFAGLVIIGLAVFLLVRNERIADPQLFFALRLVLSFAAAVLGATIPGFLSLGYSGAGLTVRAGGALALFVLTFVYTPDLAAKSAEQVIINAPGGVGAQTINNSPITIGNTPGGGSSGSKPISEGTEQPSSTPAANERK